MSEWQLIETHDGSDGLVLIALLKWGKGPEFISAAARKIDGKWRRDGYNPDESNEDFCFHPPTHWMPLPDPPVARASSGSRASEKDQLTP